MKMFLFSVALAAALSGSVSSQAQSAAPPSAIVKAFQNNFSDVQQVQWEALSGTGVYTADFEYRGERVRAYFGTEGGFLGTARNIPVNQLPILASRELAQRYPGARVSEVSELSLQDGVDYYITVSTAKGNLILKATGTGELTVHQRQKVGA
jgi:hypothetical protein